MPASTVGVGSGGMGSQVSFQCAKCLNQGAITLDVARGSYLGCRVGIFFLEHANEERWQLALCYVLRESSSEMTVPQSTFRDKEGPIQ